MRQRGRFLLGIGLGLILVWTGMATAQDEGTEFFALAQSQDEFDAVNAIVAETDSTARLGLAEAFLAEYPESEMTHQVLGMRMQSYVDLENHQTVIDTSQAVLDAETAFYESKRAQFETPEEVEGYAAFQHESMNARRLVYQSLMGSHRALGNLEAAVENGERALATLETDWEEFSPTLDDGGPEFDEEAQNFRQNRLFYLQVLMTSYQSLDDADNTVKYAQLALELDPQNLATLITVSSVMAERPPADEDAREDHFELAQEYAEDALEVLERFLSGPGAGMGAAQQADLLSGAHSTLGLIYLNLEEFGDAQDEYQSALEAIPDDPVAYFRLGEAYVRDDEAEDAIEALARSVFLGGVTEQPARELLERVYEITNGSTDGLEEFIQSEGENIGNE